MASSLNTKQLAGIFGVTEDEIKAYIKEFQTIDVNKDGKINADELKTGLATFGCNVTLEQAKMMIHFADSNSDAKIDLIEFLTAITRAIKSKTKSVDQEALQAFAMFDINRDGFISMGELRITMAKLGQPLSDKEAAQLMKTYDKNKDGRIDYKEFVAAWKEMLGPKK